MSRWTLLLGVPGVWCRLLARRCEGACSVASRAGMALVLLVALLHAPLAAQAQPEAPATASAAADEPRAYGYSVGDVVQRRVQLQLPPGWRVDLDALPLARRPGQAIELRRAELQGQALLLEYQVFLAPTEVRTLELPVLRLRLLGPPGQPGPGEQFLRVDAWPLTVAPLVPVDVSPRRGLGELQPDAPLPPQDTSPHLRRLLAYAGAATVLGLLLWQRLVGLPGTARRRRPFARAWRALQRLPAEPVPQAGVDTAAAAGAQRQAFQLLHQALNRSAGQVLFAAGLPAFLAQQPAYAVLQPALAEFFRRSERTFFAQPAAGSGDAALQAQDIAWLRQLCRQLLAVERRL
jgi:mxaA protein